MACFFPLLHIISSVKTMKLLRPLSSFDEAIKSSFVQHHSARVQTKISPALMIFVLVFVFRGVTQKNNNYGAVCSHKHSLLTANNGKPEQLQQ